MEGAAGNPPAPSQARQSISAVILGNDAVVAARPATPAQLANACWAAGYDVVIPPGWGDEVVAATYLEQLAGQPEPVIIACACPRVATLLKQVPAAAPHRRLVMASPPVAAARSLRAVHGEDMLITYVGDCPGACDPSVDIRISPTELFSLLEQQGVSVAEQPAELVDDQVERWRRYRSVPGGLPALRFLGRRPVERVLRSVDAPTLAEGRIPPSRSKVLVDLADAAQCVCGGARDRIEECEPPRRVVPVVERPPGVTMTAEPSARGPRVVRLHGPPRAPIVGADESSPAEATVDVAEPALIATPPAGSTSPSQPSAQPDPPREEKPRGKGSGPLPPTQTSLGARSRLGTARRRVLAVAAVPAVVLALVAALGVGVYTASSSGEGRNPRAPAGTVGSGAAKHRADGETDGDLPRRVAPPVPLAPLSASEDSLRRVAAPPAPDSAHLGGAARPKVRRRATPDTLQLVPGWTPRGLPKFTPTDSAARKRDTSTIPPAQPDTIRPAT